MALKDAGAGAAGAEALTGAVGASLPTGENSMEGVSLMEFMGFDEMEYLEGMEDDAHDFARRTRSFK